MKPTLEELRARYEPKQATTIEASRQIHSARFSPCGKFLAGGGYDGNIWMWDVAGATPVELPLLEGHNGWVQPIEFHPSKPLMFSGDSWGQLRAWRLDEKNAGVAWSVADAHESWIRAIAVSPKGDWLATCGSDKTPRVWSTADGGKIRELPRQDDDLMCILVHPDGDSILIGDSKGLVRQWNIETLKLIKEFDASQLHLYHRIQDVGGARCLALNQEASRLAVGGTRPKGGGSVTGTPTILVFDFASGKLENELELGVTNDVYVFDVRWHDQFLMATTSGQPGAGKLVFQRPGDEEPIFVNTKMSNCHSLSLHPDGRRLAIATTNRGSNGNGRRLDASGEYAGNTSPIYLFELSTDAAAKS